MQEYLHITPHIDPRFGGLATSVPALARAMNTTGRCRTSVIAFCEADETPPTDLGVELDVYQFGRLRWVMNGSRRRRLEGRIRAASSIHIHGIWQEHCQIAASLAHMAGIPYVISAHGMLEPWALRQKAWKKNIYAFLSERRTLNRAACMRALTTAEAEHFRSFGYTGPIAVIPNGIDIPARPDLDSFWKLFPELKGKRIVLFLGRLHKKKGVETLCLAWKQIVNSFPDSALVFAGPDSDETPRFTAQLVERLGISHSVRFTGMLRGHDKWMALAAATVFVLPSFSEGFSIATLEALASATPVIISHACYFPEVTVNGCGWTIEPNVPSLAAALTECLSLPSALLNDMGVNGVSMINTSNRWTLIGRQMTDLMHKISPS